MIKAGTAHNSEKIKATGKEKKVEQTIKVTNKRILSVAIDALMHICFAIAAVLGSSGSSLSDKKALWAAISVSLKDDSGSVETGVKTGLIKSVF